MHTRESLEKYFIKTCGYDSEYIKELSDYAMFDLYLTYNGLIGFTDKIIEVAKALPSLLK